MASARHKAEIRNARPVETLTPRERETMALAIRGLSYRYIGELLGIARQTVKNRMKSVLDKTGASDLRDLVLMIDSLIH